jgi:hypothetical protein
MESKSNLNESEKLSGVRDHSAFLRSYAPEDEGLYDAFATAATELCDQAERRPTA